jgi:hypothetical protein
MNVFRMASFTRFSNICLLQIFLLLGSVAWVEATTTNFFTGFEAGDGFTAGAGWAGQGGWQGRMVDDTGSQWVPATTDGNGILSGFFPTLGQQAYIGLTPLPYYYGPLDVYTTFDPGANSGNVSTVNFSTVVQIVDSTIATNRDFFYLSIFDSQANNVAEFWFSNRTKKIYYWNDAVTNYVWSGATFLNSQSYALTVKCNATNNTWSATLGSVILATNQPITSWVTNVGAILAEWDQYDYSAPGDNYLVLDNVLVTTELATLPPPPSPTLAVLSVIPSASATLRLTGQEGYKFAILGSTTLQPGSWTPLTTNTVSGGYFDYTDSSAAGLRLQLYRAQWVP